MALFKITRQLIQGWGQFRNWNWNWCQFQFQFQELELKRNWIKRIGIGIGIDKEELKELIQFLFLIVNSFWFFAMFLAESLKQFDLKPFWIQLTRISLDRYIILYDNLSIKWILHGSYWLHLEVTCHGFCITKHDSKIFLSSNLTKKFSCKSKIVNSHLIHNEWKIMGVLFKIMLKHCLKYQSFVTLIPLIWYWNWNFGIGIGTENWKLTFCNCYCSTY